MDGTVITDLVGGHGVWLTVWDWSSNREGRGTSRCDERGAQSAWLLKRSEKSGNYPKKEARKDDCDTGGMQLDDKKRQRVQKQIPPKNHETSIEEHNTTESDKRQELVSCPGVVRHVFSMSKSLIGESHRQLDRRTGSTFTHVALSEAPPAHLGVIHNVMMLVKVYSRYSQAKLFSGEQKNKESGSHAGLMCLNYTTYQTVSEQDYCPR